MTAKALKLLWDTKILLVQERAASSDVAQVWDVTCFKPVQDACIRKPEAYKVRFGNKTVTQWELPALYSVVVDKALTRKNLKTGFTKVGLFLLMSGDAWLGKYGLTCGIRFALSKSIPHEKFIFQRIDLSARYIQQEISSERLAELGVNSQKIRLA